MKYNKYCCAVHYYKCRMGHYHGCVKFEFNDIALYTNNNSKQSLQLISQTIFHDMFIYIYILYINLYAFTAIYFTFSITVDWYKFLFVRYIFQEVFDLFINSNYTYSLCLNLLILTMYRIFYKKWKKQGFFLIYIHFIL